MKLQKTQLKKRAESNLNVVRKHNDGSEELIKEGIVADTSIKHPIHDTRSMVGMAKGITKNMGDFESLRVDVWLSAPYDNFESVKDTYDTVESVIDDVLENTVSQYIDD